MKNRRSVVLLGALLFLIPVFVKAVVSVQQDSELGVYRVLNTPYNVEFFGASKARLLLLFIILMTFQFLVLFLKKKIKLQLPMPFFFLGVYIALMAVSAYSSIYQETALMGMSDRYEGLYVHFYYTLLPVFMFWFIKDKSDILFLMKCLIFSAIPVTVVAVLQSFDIFVILSDFMKGYHFFGETPLYHSYINTYIDYHQSIVEPGFNQVSTTLFNANYVAIYGAIIFSIAGSFYVLSRSKIKSVLYGWLLVLGFILIILSTSRTVLVVTVVVTSFFLLFSLLKKKQGYLLKGVAITAICLFTFFLMDTIYEHQLIKNYEVTSNDNIQSSETQSGEKSRSKYIKSITFYEDKTVIADDYSQLVLMNDQGIIRLLDDSVNEKPWRYTAYEGYVEVRHNYSYMNFALTDNGQIGIYGPRGLTTEIDPPKELLINGHFLTHRGYTWSVALELIKEKPFIGYGPDTFVYYFPYKDIMNLINFKNNASAIAINPHNLYLNIAYSGGVISLISFLAFIIWLYIKAIKVYIQDKEKRQWIMMTFVPLTVFLILSMVFDTIIATGVILFSLIGLVSIVLYKEDFNWESTPIE